MRVKLEKRVQISKYEIIAVRIASIVLALLSIGLLFIVSGIDPFYAYSVILSGVFGSTFGISEVIVKSIPIGLCSLGLSLAYTAKVWNIGSDGQLIMGAIFATWVALFSNFPQVLILPSMFLAGFIGGLVWATVPAFLKSKYNVNEVIVTLMMNYISLNLLDYLLSGPWRGHGVFNYPITDEFPKFARLPSIPGTRIHYPTLILLILLTFLILFVMNRTKFGLEIKAMGDNLEAARISGIDTFKNSLIVMMISGGLAGIAGVGEAAGIQYRLIRNISPGYGYSAIIPAWIGGFNPVVVLVASLFVSALFVGGNIAKVSLGLSYGLINVFNGVILIFLISSEYLVGYRVRIEWT
ncbi:MAG: ABC transporter permease [Thermoproteota archaeon]|nr:ABC transporter permease [Candidatus Brockarchaeota archaeon]